MTILIDQTYFLAGCSFFLPEVKYNVRAAVKPNDNKTVYEYNNKIDKCK